MATEKQILANQQNAKHSTGPRTEAGKRRSRRNAIRHGLTVETVIDTLVSRLAFTVAASSCRDRGERTSEHASRNDSESILAPNQ
jgi:hypothetical protein